MKIIIKIIFVVILLCVIETRDTYGQTESFASISGRIVDAETNEPLVFVNVYLASTTIGTTTNEMGYYEITNIPYGMYELVISMMGYEIESRQATFIKSDMGNLNFRLKPRVLEFPEIQVEATNMKEWRKNLEKFKNEFLGRTDNASKCKILNPEVLDFKRDNESGILTATANQPLEIINRALGYRIYGVLISFTLGKRTCQYVLKPKFGEIDPEDDKEMKKWNEQRFKTYCGSFRHFITSLVDLRLNDEGFFIWNAPTLFSTELTNLNEKSLQDSLTTPSMYPSEIDLRFNNYLRIEYVMEPDQFRESHSQISYLKLMQSWVTVSTTGYSRGNNSIVKYGRWTYDRIAEELPIDYKPEKN